MKQIRADFLEAHSAVFIGAKSGSSGRNLSNKLYGTKERALDIFVFFDKGETLGAAVFAKEGFAVLPAAMIATWRPSDLGELGIELPDMKFSVTQVTNVHHDQIIAPINAQIEGGPNSPFNAQVETPTQKVQGKPGKKPKYQGEEAQGE